MHINNWLRKTLSRKYLDWAEPLPKFQGGIIAKLQDVRLDQRKAAREAHERTLPPVDTELVSLMLSMCEMFEVHHFEQVISQLLRFFPQLSDSRYARTLSDISRHGTTELRTGDISIGYIMRKPNPIRFGVCRVEPNLPNEIHSIDVTLHKILPSIFVLRFDVHPSDEAERLFGQLQKRLYLPEVEFFQVFPRFAHGFGYQRTQPEFEKKQEIIKWLIEMRSLAQKIVSPLLAYGYFTAHNRTLSMQLPVTEVYVVKGRPLKESENREWLDRAIPWLRSLGIDMFLRYESKEGCFLFTNYEGHGNRIQRTNTIQYIAWWEAYSDESSDSAAQSISSKIRYEIQEELHNTVPYVVLRGFLQTVHQHLDQLRKESLVTSSRRRRLGTHVRLNDLIHREGMLIKLILQEFGHLQPFMEKHNRHLTQYRLFRFGSDQVTEHNLLTGLQEGFLFRAEYLEKQSAFVLSSHFNYLTLRNIEAIYRLQATAALASIIALLIALANIDGIYEKVTYVWRQLVGMTLP